MECWGFLSQLPETWTWMLLTRMWTQVHLFESKPSALPFSLLTDFWPEKHQIFWSGVFISSNSHCGEDVETVSASWPFQGMGGMNKLPGDRFASDLAWIGKGIASLSKMGIYIGDKPILETLCSGSYTASVLLSVATNRTSWKPQVLSIQVSSLVYVWFLACCCQITPFLTHLSFCLLVPELPCQRNEPERASRSEKPLHSEIMFQYHNVSPVSLIECQI